MSIETHGFDWDEGNRTKCQKHGLSLAEIEWVLRHGLLRLTDDDKHSLQEKRLIAIGRTQAGRLALVGFTLRERRGHTLIRPITARYMHVREMRRQDWISKISAASRTDEELEAFPEQDLSDYVTPENFKPVRLEFLAEDAAGEPALLRGAARRGPPAGAGARDFLAALHPAGGRVRGRRLPLRGLSPLHLEFGSAAHPLKRVKVAEDMIQRNQNDKLFLRRFLHS